MLFMICLGIILGALLGLTFKWVRANGEGSYAGHVMSALLLACVLFVLASAGFSVIFLPIAIFEIFIGLGLVGEFDAIHSQLKKTEKGKPQDKKTKSIKQTPTKESPNNEPLISSTPKPQEPQKMRIPTSKTAQVKCRKCKSVYKVTILKYETAVICPKCSSSNSVHVDWNDNLQTCLIGFSKKDLLIRKLLRNT